MSLNHHRVPLEDVTPRPLVSEIFVFPTRSILRPANDEGEHDDHSPKAFARPSRWYLPTTRAFLVIAALLFAAALFVMFWA